MNDEVNQTAPSQADDFESLRRIVECLRGQDDEGKVRLLKSAITFLRLESAFGTQRPVAAVPSQPIFPTTDFSAPSSNSNFSSRTEMSPKQFLLEKQPANEIERVACLAYYLTHFRNMPEFKTLDISKLNTEAAQPKFSNPSVPVDNATRRGYIVTTSGWNKQLGALGEQFVQALPDREAAKLVTERVRLRRPRRKRNGSRSETPESNHNE
ncbi:MAG TPA: hypothetical protein VFW05_09200 [Verrucomicrobiae bacterium]|nr:hypothetical protein [Verrucomicrobiae bacterium]